MRICVLGSGSTGNCTYVGSAEEGLLIDAGLSGRETERRLAQIGVAFSTIKAVCVSHEHSDHTCSLGILQRKYQLPVYGNRGTVDGLQSAKGLENLAWKIFGTGAAFTVGGFTIEPFSVPHDAYEPVGFVIRHGQIKTAIVTDVGMPSNLLREKLKDCAAIVLEANHDARLLTDSTRPWRLKQRIQGRQGHLSNEHAAQVLANVAGPSLQQVFLAHISADCNRPELAWRQVSDSLQQAGYGNVKISTTAADTISEVWVSG